MPCACRSTILPNAFQGFSVWTAMMFPDTVLIMESPFRKDDLMAILDGIEDAVVKLDGQSKYVAMNKAAADTFRRLGQDPQTMIGKSVWEVFPEVKGTIVEWELRGARRSRLNQI